MMNIAFLGVGHIHTPGFIRLIKGREDVKVLSVWDADAARAQKRGDELGAAVAGEYREILRDKQIQAVIIASETHRHEELVLASARARKPMFVEKPLGMGGRDGYKMAAAIEKAGVLFQTGYGMRGGPAVQFIRQKIQSGAFGKITRLRGSTCHHGALGGWFDGEWRWMADPKLAGCGAFGDLGTHSLDLLIWLAGEVESVAASLSNGTSRYPDCDELGEAIIRFKNGAIGTLAASWDDLADPMTLMVSGTDAYAAVISGKLHYVEGTALKSMERDVKQLETQMKDAATAEPEKQRLQQMVTEKKKAMDAARSLQPLADLPAGWGQPLAMFLDAVAGKPDQPLCAAREVAYRSAVMEAMYKAAQTKKWVAPKEVAAKPPAGAKAAGNA